MIKNSDLTIIENVTRSYEFEKSTTESFNISTNMIAGSIAVILGMAVASLILIRKRRNDAGLNSEDFDDLGKPVKMSGPPVSGPPIQSFTNQQDSATVEQSVVHPQIPQPIINQNQISSVAMVLLCHLVDCQMVGRMSNGNITVEKYLDNLNNGG